MRARAAVLARVRAFFRERGVLEVETPILCAAGAVDEHLEPIPVDLEPIAVGLQPGPGGGKPADDAASPRGVGRRYLVTSPEHSMKRLLAAGAGAIYQVTRAFRAGDRGRLHNPEFTILEWYRPGLDHVGLMEEVEDLTRVVLGDADVAAPGLVRQEAERPFERLSYRDAFLRFAGVDPFRDSTRELVRAATERGAALGGTGGDEARLGGDGDRMGGDEDRDGILNLLLALAVEPALAARGFLFLTDYPTSQAALARVHPGDPPTAERFELYFRGVELANGYHELSDPGEQERRFAEANARRRDAGKPELPLDRDLIDALRAGLPDCAGVAVGVDRLVMLAHGAQTIDDVLAFPFERA